MKTFYNEYNMAVGAGAELQNRAIRLLNPLIDEYEKEGYSVREISHLIQQAVSCSESERAIRHSMNIRISKTNV